VFLFLGIRNGNAETSGVSLSVQRIVRADALGGTTVASNQGKRLLRIAVTSG